MCKVTTKCMGLHQQNFLDFSGLFTTSNEFQAGARFWLVCLGLTLSAYLKLILMLLLSITILMLTPEGRAAFPNFICKQFFVVHNLRIKSWIHLGFGYSITLL